MHKLTEIWDEFTSRYEASTASLNTYQQKYQVFLKWVIKQNANNAEDKKLRHMEQITREIAEDYARYIFKRKTSANKDIGNLKRIWEVMLPDQKQNPWKIGLHLRPPLPKKPCNYRPLLLSEARRFIKAAKDAADKADEKSPNFDMRYKGEREKYLDIADAAFFAWHYGMRMGSLVSLSWEDFSTWRKGYFLHVPPKTKYTKQWPLEITVVPEVRAVLETRSTGKKQKGKIFPALAEAHSLCASNLTASIKALFKAAGVHDTYKGRAQMHSFRATFITQMDEAGAPSGITDSITGHAPRSVHNMYSHARHPALKRWLGKAIAQLTVTES